MSPDTERPIHGLVVRLDGPGWSMAIDPMNQGRERKWYNSPPPESRPTRVPGVMQDHFPDYHGVAWYWREFAAPKNPHSGGRFVLRFHAVDYSAEVWANGTRIGQHEGSEEPFEFDATEAVRPGAHNLLAVRVLNPTEEPIDGIRMSEVPVGRRQNGMPSDNAYNTGGITDSVELHVVSALRVTALHVIPDYETGVVRVRTNVGNAGREPVRGRVQVTVAPAVGGESVAADACEHDFATGDT